MHIKKVLVGLSGGVDSAVAALLLKKQGFEVIGYTLKFGEKENKCCMIDDASLTASQLGIKYFTIDIYEEFEQDIIGYFIKEYINARTPSPCPKCNLFKFGIALEYANIHNIDYIATGHYALVKNGELYASASPKDQSYFLSLLPKSYFKKILFPLGNSLKSDIRKEAEKANLKSANKKDSQDICFVKDDYRNFLKSRGIKSNIGYFRNLEGEILGEHQGFFNYTIGQRFKIGGLKERKYIVSLDSSKNEVIVGNEQDLYSSTIKINNFNLLTNEKELFEDTYIKIRSKDSFHEGKIEFFSLQNKSLIYKTDNRIKAVTPGQLAVIYIKQPDGTPKVAGGGWIE